MPDLRRTNPTVMLVCASVILTLALGIRHSFGLFLQPMSMDNGWGREVFGFAVAVQNLLWGITQPFTGMLADRFGAGRVLFAGGLLYALVSCSWRTRAPRSGSRSRSASLLASA